MFVILPIIKGNISKSLFLKLVKQMCDEKCICLHYVNPILINYS